MMAKFHEFNVKIGDVVVAVIGGQDRKAAVNEAARVAMVHAGEGFSDVSIDGVEKEDFDAIEAVAGWPKTVVQ
jgi:hypothetical protein